MNYKTTDIILAAVLRNTGVKLVDIEINGNKGTFVFENVPTDLLDRFDFGKVLVEPVEFNNEIKNLTTIIHRKVRTLENQQRK